ncbi:MAG: hypothetical protein LBJ95_04440 [Oscillospiraceae bacterium]|nr:hypothetical protein [Oscillospiraceae bacterium]
MYIMKISWLKKAVSNCCKIKKKTPSKGEYCTIFCRKQPLPAALQWLNNKPNLLK